MIKENMAKLCPFYTCVDDGNCNCFDHPVYIQTCCKNHQMTSLVKCSHCRDGDYYRKLIEIRLKELQKLSVVVFADCYATICYNVRTVDSNTIIVKNN